jgi:hypothetical protein
VNMARFAKDCMYKMWALSKKLEVRLRFSMNDGQFGCVTHDIIFDCVRPFLDRIQAI